MRVFVTGPGRCGTVTFFQACSHITNYTADHESKRGPRHLEDWDFPDWHIEVASNLIIGLPFLKRKYPDALWFYLKRDSNSCMTSLSRECKHHMIQFVKQWWYYPPDLEPITDAASLIFYRFCEAQFFGYNPKGQAIHLNRFEHDFMSFWKVIKAEGDRQAALKELNRKYNAKDNRGRDAWIPIK